MSIEQWAEEELARFHMCGSVEATNFMQAGIRRGLLEAAERVRSKAQECDDHGTQHFCDVFGCQTLDRLAAELRALAEVQR